MKKIVILIIALFLITGCSVKYNVVINEDLTVNEEAKISGTERLYEPYYKTTKKHVLESFLDIYNNFLKENNYQYKLVEEKEPYITINKKYNNVEEYINNSILFNDYFDEIKYTENGSKKKIETVGFHENEIDNPDRFYVEELEIAIKCSYKVKNHTATKVDKMTNTYYYELNENNDRILLEYDVSSKFNPNEDLIKTIIICVVIILGIWILVYYFSKKNNKNI